MDQQNSNNPIFIGQQEFITTTGSNQLSSFMRSDSCRVGVLPSKHSAQECAMFSFPELRLSFHTLWQSALRIWKVWLFLWTSTSEHGNILFILSHFSIDDHIISILRSHENLLTLLIFDVITWANNKDQLWYGENGCQTIHHSATDQLLCMQRLLSSSGRIEKREEKLAQSYLPINNTQRVDETPT